MSIAISIEMKDTGRPVLRALADALAPLNIGMVLGRSATNTIREHLFGLNQSRPNSLGGRRTQYYATSARATQYQLVPDGVIISVNQIGIAQRYYGGVITPKTAKYLTIPARAEAHGKRASEFNDLVLVFGRGGQPVALARAEQTKLVFGKDGKTRKGKASGGVILFWLVKSVNQQPDPTVLPYDELIETRASEAATNYIDRQIQRAGGLAT